MDELQSTANVRFLGNKLKEVDISKFFDSEKGSKLFKETIFSPQDIDATRKEVNAASRSLGDQVVDTLGLQFLETHPASYENLPALLKFARAWNKPEVGDKDVVGLYTNHALSAYGVIATFMTEEVARLDDSPDEVDAELQKYNLSFKEISSELERNNFNVDVKESDFSKGISGLFSNTSYTLRKTKQKAAGFVSKAESRINNRSLTTEKSDWPAREGVEIKRILLDGQEQAILIKCDPKTVKAKVLAEQGKRVDMKEQEYVFGNRIIFSAPIAMSIAQKMTEPAFKDGEQVSWLRGEKDGYVLVNPEGEAKILDKNNLNLGDLLTREDFANKEIKAAITSWLNIKKSTNQLKSDEDITAVLNYVLDLEVGFADKKLFNTILDLKKYSLLVNMILINNGEIAHLKDRPMDTSRRLFVTLSDGSFGIVDSTIDMTTELLLELASKMGVERAVYMDTGQYDMATYRDGVGKDHILGHEDTDESTNRILFYSAKK